MRDAFEQACYQHYLEQHKAGKHGSDTPMALKSLMWRQENGQYGVLAFNSAWFGWESAMKHAADQPMLPKAHCLRCVTPKKCSVWGCYPGTWPAEADEDKELRAAISELRTALGNPVISGEGMQTVASQTVRAAVERLTRKTFVNMGAQALAAELIEAVVKDEADEGLDISAGLFGTHTSEWLRHVAEDYMANPPKPSTCPGVPRAGCNYLATCGSVCYKCGELHAPKGGNF